ncbi:MAG: A24 family peptidase [Alphaproteobacteria bacterium]|nr:A24 family peptidase [Alphaproteobacteria bacterium]MCD8571025.1 A24 family peptidase [Alphaproteobacteria bacterium]
MWGGALTLLCALSVIDLKHGLLPNELVLGLACTGVVFHSAFMFHHVNLEDMAIGAFIGGGILFLIREIANRVYQEDTLGLGDVKLMAAGGVWLGPEGILIALTLGALAGFLHGLFAAITSMARAGVKSDLSRFSIPAGPGFAVGLVLAALYQFTGWQAWLGL